MREFYERGRERESYMRAWERLNSIFVCRKKVVTWRKLPVISNGKNRALRFKLKKKILTEHDSGKLFSNCRRARSIPRTPGTSADCLWCHSEVYLENTERCFTTHCKELEKQEVASFDSTPLDQTTIVDAFSRCCVHQLLSQHSRTIHRKQRLTWPTRRLTCLPNRPPLHNKPSVGIHCSLGLPLQGIQEFGR